MKAEYSADGLRAQQDKTLQHVQGSGMDMSGAAASAEKQTTREVLKQMVKSTGQRSLYVTPLSACLSLHGASGCRKCRRTYASALKVQAG